MYCTELFLQEHWPQLYKVGRLHVKQTKANHTCNVTLHPTNQPLAFDVAAEGNTKTVHDKDFGDVQVNFPIQFVSKALFY